MSWLHFANGSAWHRVLVSKLGMKRLLGPELALSPVKLDHHYLEIIYGQQGP
jgi:hypothetical protein